MDYEPLSSMKRRPETMVDVGDESHIWEHFCRYLGAALGLIASAIGWFIHYFLRNMLDWNIMYIYKYNFPHPMRRIINMQQQNTMQKNQLERTKFCLPGSFFTVCRYTLRMRLQTNAVFWLHIFGVRIDMVDTMKMNVGYLQIRSVGNIYRGYQISSISNWPTGAPAVRSMVKSRILVGWMGNLHFWLANHQVLISMSPYFLVYVDLLSWCLNHIKMAG